VGGSGPQGSGASFVGAVGVDIGCPIVGEVARARKVVVVSTGCGRVDNRMCVRGWGVEDAKPM
jgi:hypothetical protein